MIILCPTNQPTNQLFKQLTNRSINQPTTHKRTKAEGTEGEAESLLLRKLLKNQNRLIDSIRLMDVDRDGVISTAEFRAAIVAMNVGLTERQVEKLIRSIDVDKDGELDMQVTRACALRKQYARACSTFWLNYV